MQPKRDDLEYPSSWSIHDVSPQARELARAEAEREGVSLGDWLARRISGELSRVAPGSDEPQRSHRRLAASVEPARRSESGLEPRRDRPLTENSHTVDEAMQAMQRLIESNRSAQEFAGFAMQNVVSEINAAARDQATVLDAMNDRIERVEGGTEALAHRNEEIAGRLGALAGGLESLGQTITTARSTSDRLGLFVQEQLSTFAERLRTTEQRVAGYPELETAFAELTRAHAGTSSKLDELSRHHDVLSAGLAVTRDLSERIGARLAAVAERIGDYPKLQESVANLSARSEEVAVQIARIASSTEKLGGAIATAERGTSERASQIQECLDAIATRVQSAEERTSSYAAVEQIVIRLGAESEAERRDIGALTEAAARLGNDIATARAEAAEADDGLRTALSALGERLRGNEDRLAALPKIEETLAFLSKRDNEVIGLISVLASNLQKLEDDIRAVADRATRVDQLVAERSDQFAQRLKSAEEHLGDVARAHNAIARLDARDEEVAVRVESLSSALERCTTELAIAQTEVERMNERIASAEIGLGKLPEITDSIVGLNGEIAAATNISNALTGRIETAESQLAGLPQLSDAVALLSRNGTEIPARLEGLRDSIQTVQSEIAAAKDISGALSQRIESSEKKLAGLPQLSDAVASLSRNDAEMPARLEGLRDSVQTLQREIAAAKDISGALSQRIESSEKKLAGLPQLSDAVASLSRNDAEMPARLEGLRDSVQTLQREIAAAKDISGGLSQRIQATEEKLAGLPPLSEAVASLSRNDAEMPARLEGLRDSMQTLQSEIAAAKDISGGLSQRIQATEEKLAGLPQLCEAVASLSHNDAEMPARLGGLRDSMQALQREIGANKDISNGLAGRLETVEAQLAALPQLCETVASLTGDDTEMPARLEGLCASTQALQSAITAANNISGELRQRIEVSEEKLAGLPQLSEAVASLSRNDAEMPARLGALRDSMQALHNEIAATKDISVGLAGRIDTAEQRLAGQGTIADAVANLESRLGELNQHDDAVSLEVKSFQDILAAVRSDSERFGAFVEEKLNAFAEHVSSADARMDALAELETSVSELSRRMDEESEKQAEKADDGSYAADVEALAQCMKQSERLANGFDSLRDALAGVQQALTKVQLENRDGLKKLQANVDVLTGRLAAVESAASAHTSQRENQVAFDLQPLELEALPPVLAELPPFPDFDQGVAAPSGAEANPEPAPPVEPSSDYLNRAREAANSAVESARPEKKSKSFSSLLGERLARAGFAPLGGFAAILAIALVGFAFWMVHNAGGPAKRTPIAAKPLVAQVRPGAPVARATEKADTKPPVTPAGELSDLDRVTRLAENGDTTAMLALGIAYASGKGVTADAEAAGQWLERAANAGNPVAQFEMGVRNERGIGSAKDLAQALAWYRRAAGQGNRTAMYNLAIGLATGSGTKRDLEEAVKWFQSAAALGLKDAEFNLAVLYEHGMGVKPSLADAYKWYALAAAAGDSEAKTRSEAIATQIPAEARDAADRAVAAFQPGRMDPKANIAPDLADVGKP
jgi:chromosome segregation ATPase